MIGLEGAADAEPEPSQSAPRSTGGDEAKAAAPSSDDLPKRPRRRGLGHFPLARPASGTVEPAGAGLISSRSRLWRPNRPGIGAIALAAVALAALIVTSRDAPQSDRADEENPPIAATVAAAPAPPPPAPAPEPRPPNEQSSRSDAARPEEGRAHDGSTPDGADPVSSAPAVTVVPAAPPPTRERFGFER